MGVRDNVQDDPRPAPSAPSPNSGPSAQRNHRTERGEGTEGREGDGLCSPGSSSRCSPDDTGPDMLGDLEAVKSLVRKLGAEQVRRIVGLLED